MPARAGGSRPPSSAIRKVLQFGTDAVSKTDGPLTWSGFDSSIFRHLGFILLDLAELYNALESAEHNRDTDRSTGCNRASKTLEEGSIPSRSANETFVWQEGTR